MENVENELNDTIKVYEAGFLLVPFISEEQVTAEAADIKAIIEKNGGVVIHEEAPKLRPLAYEISKVTAGQKRKNDKAFFGFVKFTALPEAAVTIKADLDKKDTIIRFILIKTIKDNTLYGAKAVRSENGKLNKKADDKDEKDASLDEATIDKTIDQLVIE